LNRLSRTSDLDPRIGTEDAPLGTEDRNIGWYYSPDSHEEWICCTFPFKLSLQLDLVQDETNLHIHIYDYFCNFIFKDVNSGEKFSSVTNIIVLIFHGGVVR
jgi:hypothetical protein